MVLTVSRIVFDNYEEIISYFNKEELERESFVYYFEYSIFHNRRDFSRKRYLDLDIQTVENNLRIIKDALPSDLVYQGVLMKVHRKDKSDTFNVNIDASPNRISLPFWDRNFPRANIYINQILASQVKSKQVNEHLEKVISRSFFEADF